MVLITIAVFLLNREKIEKRLLKNISFKISNLLKTTVQISDVDFKYNGDLVINNFNIFDHKNDTLIYIDKITTSILTTTNILTSNTKLSSLGLSNGIIKIIKHPGDSLTNFEIFINKVKQDNNTENKNFSLELKNLSLNDFRVDLVNKSNLTNQLNDFNITVYDLKYLKSQITLYIDNASYIDLYGLRLDDFYSKVTYSQSGFNMTDFIINSTNSKLKGSLSISEINKMGYADSNIEMNLLDSKISTNEINLYYNSLISDELIEFSTFLYGSFNNTLNGRLDFQYGDKTKAKINFSIEDLFGKIKVYTVLEDFYTNYDDLKTLPVLKNYQIPDFLISTEFISINGVCDYENGLISNKYVVDTDFGELILDINLIDFLIKPKESKFYGTVKFNEFLFKDFNLFSSTIRTSANFILDGSIYPGQPLNTSVSGVVSDLSIGDSVFNNILINGRTNNDRFTGNISSSNKKLNFDFNGFIDYSKEIKSANFNLDLDNLQIDIDKSFNAGLIINLKGTNIKDLTGSILFSDSNYTNNEKTYSFKQLKVSSFLENNERVTRFNSPSVINGFVKGDLDIKKLKLDLEESIKYNIYEKDFSTLSSSSVSTTFEFNIYSDLVSVFFPYLSFDNNTIIKGLIDDDPSNFKLEVTSPRIQFNNFAANSLSLSLDNSKSINNFMLQTQNISFNGIDSLNYISLNKSTINDSSIVELDMEFFNKANNSIHTEINYYLNNDNLYFDLNNSKLIYNEKDWNLTMDSVSYYNLNNQILNISNLKLLNNKNKIIVNTNYEKNYFSYLSLYFENLSLDNFPVKSKELKLSGILNGKFIYDINSSNESKLKVDDLALNEYNFGLLETEINYDNKLSTYNFEAHLSKDSLETLYSKGDLILSDTINKADLVINLNKLPINALNIIGKNNIDNIKGNATGYLKIKNLFGNPDFTGNLLFNNSGLRIPYTKVGYLFAANSSVVLEDNKFVFNNIDFEDSKFVSKGKLNGVISHNSFSSWLLDLEIESERLLILDTKDINNPVYYGTAFVSGGIKINGPGDRLLFDADISSEKGTVFNIPLNESKNFTENISYIKFADNSANTFDKKKYKLDNIKGVELNFNLNLNKNAEIEILIDRSSGSTIKGFGNGNLIMEINNKGKFNMFGDFIVDNGKYNFVYAGILKKEFELNKGGSLTWAGDPLKALINLQTSYTKIEANPSILLDNPINLSIPVSVNVNLTGELLNPTPEFKLEFPNVDSSINNELQYRLNDKESNQFQALSLLATGSFQNDINFDEQALFGNLAESAASIINNILFDENDKLKFGLDYQIGESTPDYKSDDKFGVTLTTRLSENILINGKLGVPIGGVTESVIAGDFEIELKLNSDRTLTMKIFNRENTIRNFGEQIGYTQGVGVSYKVEFNNFKKLIKKIFK